MTEVAIGSKNGAKGPTRRDEVMGWLLLTMLYTPQLLDMRNTAFTGVGGFGRGATEKLEALGCKRRALIATAVLGTNAVKFYPPISAEQVRETAGRIRSTVMEMNKLVPQILVPVGEILEDGSLEIQYTPAAGDLQLEPWVEEKLLQKAAFYEELAAMCTAKEVPSRAEFGRVGLIWPLVYVEEKTGEPHYALVARLLQEANVVGGMTGRRLREAYVSIKQRHPAVLRWLRLATSRLETLEGEGKMVLFAHAHDQNESAEHTNDSGEDRVGNKGLPPVLSAVDHHSTAAGDEEVQAQEAN